MSTNKSHAVGIDLGTTYSCIAWLNEHGQPVTIANQEGELATPSVVLIDGNDFVVGTEALRNAIAHPDRVIQNAKRFIGNAGTVWNIEKTTLTPELVSSQILRKLLASARVQIGDINEAVVTVPAQFSDLQRHATIQAGHAAGLERVEIINEPVAAALCHVLGNEGLAFTELAIDQQLLIFDLGGGTLDLSVVRYNNDHVRVIASDGDLELGGLDWTNVLVDVAAERFISDFKEDPRREPESHQALTLEAEQAKRSLSVRPRAAITVQHAGNRQTYQIEQAEFEHLSRKLLKRSAAITRRILADNGLGWAHIDVLLNTGGASRMPMIKSVLQKISGRTLTSTLSPDQSIAHGAAYYAGMLLSNSKYARTVFSSQASARLSRMRQESVNARSLGIMIRDNASGDRVPHYIIPSNTSLPISRPCAFGTVVDNQTTVHVRIVESGAGVDKPPTEIGECYLTHLPPGLPSGSHVEVTISYDTQARVHVTAREPNTNVATEVEFIRQENLSGQLEHSVSAGRPAGPTTTEPTTKQPAAVAVPPADHGDSLATQSSLKDASVTPASESAEELVLRCRACNSPLNANGECESEECITDSQALRKWVASSDEARMSSAIRAEDEFWNLVDED
jgi:molecular chaperone DnaK